MVTPGVFARIIVAVLAVTAAYLLMPPIFRIVRFPLTSDVDFVLRVCIAVCALYYILRGPLVPWRP